MITKIHLLRVINPAGVENMCLNLTKIDKHNRNIAVYTCKDSSKKMLAIFKNIFDKVIHINQQRAREELTNLINLEKNNNKNLILISWFFPFNIKFYPKLNVAMLNHIGTTAYAYKTLRKIKNQLIFLNLYFFKKNKVAFIYASNHIKKSYQKTYFFPKSVLEKVIYNGDLKVINNPSINSLNKIRFGMIGRLEKIKNFREYISFCFQFSKKKLGHEYLIIGDGEELEELKSYNSNYNSVCKFLGKFYDTDQIYNKIDILLFFNTKFEGFGNVIIESMNRGKLVIVKDCGGPAELVDDGYTGIKFRNVNELNIKLENLLNDHVKFNTIIQNAKKKFDQIFDINQTKINYDIIIKKLLSN